MHFDKCLPRVTKKWRTREKISSKGLDNSEKIVYNNNHNCG